MSANQLEAYKATKKLYMSGREVEAGALRQAAFKIKECQNNWNAADRDLQLHEALMNNQNIWSILQSELIKEDNPLPRQIKEDILNLSIFVDKRIFEVLAYPAPEKLNILIDINLNIAAGLSQNPSNNEQVVGQALPKPQKNHFATSFSV